MSLPGTIWTNCELVSIEASAKSSGCTVSQAVPVGNYTLFLGEVVDAGFQKPEDTPVLRMEDTRMNYGG